MDIEEKVYKKNVPGEGRLEHTCVYFFNQPQPTQPKKHLEADGIPHNRFAVQLHLEVFSYRML